MTIDLLPQQPMPSHPRRRDGRAPLPAPEDRARLRRAWRLTEEQVAESFGVTVATVRSWEAGRSTPAGPRRGAYAAFLTGLAHGLVPGPADAAGPPAGRPPRQPRRTRRRRRTVPATAARQSPAARANDRTEGGRTAVPAGAVTAGLPVGPAPDPVSPGRLRRFRFVCAAVGAWLAVAHLTATVPPPHP